MSISRDFPGPQAFLHAHLEETPTGMKSPEGSAVTAEQAGVGEAPEAQLGPMGQLGFDASGGKAAVVPAHRHPVCAQRLQVPGGVAAAHRRPADERE